MSNLTRFGQEIRKYRIEKCMNLARMANDLDVTSAYLSAIETGARRLTDGFLDKIIEVIDASPDFKMHLRKIGEEFRGSNRYYKKDEYKDANQINGFNAIMKNT